MAELDQDIADRFGAAIAAHKESGNKLHDELITHDAQLKEILQLLIDPQAELGDLDIHHPEFGILPFLAQNPEVLRPHLDDPDLLLAAVKIMSEEGMIPAPTITLEEVERFLSRKHLFPIIGPDGTAYGFAPYQQLNLNWLVCIFNGLLTEVYKKASFGDTDPEPIPLADGDLTFAVIADWGTAEPNALALRDAAMTKGPDYFVHLGDVYYTGTPKNSLRHLYFQPDVETKHLMDNWPSLPEGRSFTMNSNHEMYPGAWGLFESALRTTDSTIFQHMQGRSYFLLYNDDWQIFGLDSAYNAPDFMYMQGALNAQQIAFVQKHYDSTKKAIVLTHHNPYDLKGQTPEEKDGVSLLADVKEAFGGDLPEYWYFGHIHDGVVYAEKDGMKMRCLGHASMPYGAPWSLVTSRDIDPPYGPGDYIDGIEFAASTPVDPANPKGLVQNGFITFTLSGDTLTEAFFDGDGTQRWPLPD